jgi:hypothetical protein
MAIITITSNTKPIDLPSDGYAPCCGQTPEVITWNKGIGKGCIGVLCRNPQCENHIGVLAADVDIHRKWEQFRKEVSLEDQKRVQALFQCHDVLERKGADGSATAQIVKLGAAYAPDPKHPNYEFWKATPTAQLEMTINNPDAFGVFVSGRQYLLTFERVEG